MRRLNEQTCDELLPWLVNGTLSSHEGDATARYARSNLAARRELRALEALHDHVRDRFGEDLRIQLDIERARQSIRRDRRPSSLSAALGAVLLAVLVAGLVIPTLFVQRSRAPFTTLTTPVSTSGTLRVVFAETVDPATIRQFIDERGARIVSGPSGMGIYTVALAEGASPVEVARDWEDDERIQFAQPVLGE